MKILLLFLTLIITTSVQAIKLTSGTISTIENFKSAYVSSRNVHIWVPDNYQKTEKYAVVYMHDGQMLFDASITWNKQEWGVDEVAGQLINKGKVKPFIVVGIDNGGADRHRDYFPQKAFNLLSQDEQTKFYQLDRSESQLLFNGPVNSDNYLKFLVTELKPYIEQHFAVDTRQEATFVMGSSMGGLISLYALSEYPAVFGGAACLSTHWPGVMPHPNNPIPNAFYQYIEASLPSPGKHKIYFDYGNKTLDAAYPPLQKQVDAIMMDKGYNKINWQTLFFDGQDHSENAWRSRLDKPLLFLLAVDAK